MANWYYSNPAILSSNKKWMRMLHLLSALAALSTLADQLALLGKLPCALPARLRG
jgi:hypothetical protein